MPAKTEEWPDHTIQVGAVGALMFLDSRYGATPGKGWAAFFIYGAEAPLTFLRFAATTKPATTDGTVAAPFYDIVELQLADADGLTGRDLRALPLGQIEAAVNQASTADQMARYASDNTGNVGLSVPDIGAAALAGASPHRYKRRRPRMQVRVPEGHKKPDSFYEQIAYRYRWLQGEGVKSPAEELAEANGVPATTIHRWIKEARRRGLMAGGQRGRKDTP